MLTHTYTHTGQKKKKKRTIPCSVFVAVAGNWRVFIRLMDMKRKREGG